MVTIRSTTATGTAAMGMTATEKVTTGGRITSGHVSCGQAVIAAIIRVGGPFLTWGMAAVTAVDIKAPSTFELFAMQHLQIHIALRSLIGADLISCAVALLLGSGVLLHAADQATPAPTAASTGAQTQPGQTADNKEQQERLVSLVLLTSEPRKLSHDLIAHAISEGVGAKVTSDAVVSKPPYHLVTVGSDKFIINDIAQPYFEKSGEVADEIKNPNLSRAVRDHRGWVSVDWVTTEGQPDLRNVYRMIGKMVAHLSDKGTLAVYSPDMDQFALWAPTVRQGLEGDDPLAVFEPAEPNQQSQAGTPAPTTTATP